MIEAYCDESGIHDGAAFCVVVGFVGSARNWQLFENRWAKASGGVDFHGKEFFARVRGQRVGPYKGWTDQKARDYLIGLADVVATTDVLPIGSVINVKDFNALSLDDRKYLTGAIYTVRAQRFRTSGAPNKPFFLGFGDCMAAAAAHVRKPKWKVNIVWDRQNQFAGLATELFQTALEKGIPGLHDRLGELSFKPKTGLGGLQAADLLAHTAYKRSGLAVGANKELDMATLRLRPKTVRRIRLYDSVSFPDRLQPRDADDVRRHWASRHDA